MSVFIIRFSTTCSIVNNGYLKIFNNAIVTESDYRSIFPAWFESGRSTCTCLYFEHELQKFNILDMGLAYYNTELSAAHGLPWTAL